MSATDLPAGSPDKRATRFNRPASRVAYVLVGIVALLIVGGVAYYVLDQVKTSAFNRARAFRVLGEVAEQFQNLQENMVGVLNVVPDGLKGKCTEACAQADARVVCAPGRQAAQQEACDRNRREFSSKLALPLTLESPTVSVDVLNSVCDSANQVVFLLNARQPQVPLRLFSCPGRDVLQKEQTHALDYALVGKLPEAVDTFISQSFFDEVLITQSDGTVLSELPMQDRSAVPGEVRLHGTKIRLLSVTDSTRLLQRAADEIARADKDGQSPKSAPAGDAQALLHPVVFSESIGGQGYGVFVVAFRLMQPTFSIGEDAKPHPCTLYLVGLKKEDARTDIATTLGPSGMFAITIVVAGIFFAFPLASLRLKQRQDPITWLEAAGSVLSLLFLAGVLTVAVVWFWSYRQLERWADDGAGVYARSVSARLSAELGSDAALLEQYKEKFYATVLSDFTWRGGEGKDDQCWFQVKASANLPLRVDWRDSRSEPSSYVLRRPSPGTSAFPLSEEQRDASGRIGTDACTTLRLIATDLRSPLRSWSPLRTTFAAQVNGQTVGPRVTAYSRFPVSRGIKLGDRQYFKALERNQHWSMNVRLEQGGSRTVNLVAQRVFNRGDGARVLQVAIPSFDGRDNFNGFISGDGRVHGLTASVTALFLKFAVIDRRGAVLFHWDDSRSLTENFFVESEQNSALRSAVDLGEEASFGGRYNGEAHRFHYLPLDGVPWGVVVFYPVRMLGELPSQAGISALIAYAALVLLAVAIALAVGAMVGLKRVALLVRRCWPNAAAAKNGGMRAAVSTPVAKLTLLLGVFAVLPVAWFALRFHDAQLEALIRDGLETALDDIGRREIVIDHDLRRWDQDRLARLEWLPSARTLAQHPNAAPVPGFAMPSPKNRGGCAADTWCANVFAAPPFVHASGGSGLGRWLKYVWEVTSPTGLLQDRRLKLIEDDDRKISKWWRESADGRTVRVAFDPVQRSEGATPAHRKGLDPWVLHVLSIVVVIVTAVIAMVCAATVLARQLVGAAHTWPRRNVEPGVIRDDRISAVLYRIRGGHSLPAPRLRELADVISDRQIIDLAGAGDVSKSPRLYRFEETYLLLNLEAAIVDPQRRVAALELLERLIAADVGFMVPCQRSPLPLLHHPDLYPELRPEDAPDRGEVARWDSVLSKLFHLRQRRARSGVFRRQAFSRAMPALPLSGTVDYHRTWKLCTRAERLALFHMAMNKLANPRNSDVIAPLIHAGLVVADPWPRIANAGFRRFVRAAESGRDISDWHREASWNLWKTIRTPLMVILLIVLLILVSWFSWAGGETFKVFSAVVMATVGLLGQLSSGFNIVRNAGAASRN